MLDNLDSLKESTLAFDDKDIQDIKNKINIVTNMIGANIVWNIKQEILLPYLDDSLANFGKGLMVIPPFLMEF